MLTLDSADLSEEESAQLLSKLIVRLQPAMDRLPLISSASSCHQIELHYGNTEVVLNACSVLYQAHLIVGRMHPKSDTLIRFATADSR